MDAARKFNLDKWKNWRRCPKCDLPVRADWRRCAFCLHGPVSRRVRLRASIFQESVQHSSEFMAYAARSLAEC